MSLDLLTRRSSSVGAEARRWLPRGSAVAARQVVGIAGLVSVSVGVVLLNPVLVLCGLVMTTTALLMRRISWDLALPAAALALLTISTLVGVAGGFLDVDLLAKPWLVASIYLGYAGVGAYWVWRPAVPLLTRPAPTGGFGWAAYSCAAMAAGIGLAQSFFERMAPSWAFVATDLSQHMINVADIQRSGALDYSTTAYPRAFHMLAGFVSVPNPPLDHPVELLSYDARLVAAASWLSLALVLWTGSTLALRFGAARGMPRLSSVGAAALFGAGALLTNSFVVTFVYMGAAASLLAIVVIFALPLAVLGLETSRTRLLVLPVLTAASVMLLAHLWQPLVVVPLLAFAAYAAAWVRDGVALVTRRRPPHELVGPLALVMAASLVMLAAGSVPLLSIQSAGGVALASTAGHVPAVPWFVLLGGLTFAAWLARDFRRGSTRAYLGSIGGLLGVAAIMLRWGDHGLDLHQYYPMKALWFLTIVLAPVLALATVDLGWRLLRPVWRQLDRFGRSTRVCRIALAASLGALAFAFALPPLLGNAPATSASLARQSPDYEPKDMVSMGPVSAQRLDIARDYGTRYSPALTVPVAVGLSAGWDRFGPYIISKLISFQTGQPQNQGQAGSVCSDVAGVTGGSADAVVITQMDAGALRAIMKKNGCGDVPVVKIPGGESAP